MHDISSIDYNLLKEKYDENQFSLILKKILEENYPVQYAIGNVEFVNVMINVDERVLIPRFATELLVSKTIDYMRTLNLDKSHVLDVCTGSGAIAIALKKNLPNIKIKAYDVSNDALNLAKENALLNKVDVNFIHCDILDSKFMFDDADVLISNPPYVRLNEVVSENTKYEPKIALYPGEDELIFYKEILKKCSFKNFKLIAFEIGALQGECISDIAHDYFPNSKIKIEKDFEGYDRYIFIFNE